MTSLRKEVSKCVLLFSASISLSAGIAFSQAAGEKTKDKAAGVEQEKPAEPPNAAQIELLETKYRFETNGDSRKEVHALVKINSELGVRQFARLNFDYNRSFQSVEIPLAHITHANGGTSDILPSAITDAPNPAVEKFPAYHDVRVKSVRILGLQPGDSLEYRVITTTTKHPLAPDFWLDHTFERSGVISEEIFELDLPGHPEPATDRHRLNIWVATPPAALFTGVPISSEEHVGSAKDERSIFRWHFKGTPQQSELETGRSQPADIVVTTFRSWGSLAERLKSQSPKWSDDEWMAVTSRTGWATTSAGTPADKLRAAYQLLSRDIRTVDLPLEAQGFQIRSGKEVLESNYGTSLEKCKVLAAIAIRLGFKAETALNGTDNLEEEYARPASFTQSFVLAIIDQKFVTLDPSVEVAPFGLIAPKFRGQPLLSLSPFALGDTIRVWITPPPVLPFASTQQVKTASSLNSSGALTTKVTYALRGDNELLLRVAFHKAPPEKQNEIAQYLALSDGFRGKVTSVKTSDPYDTDKPFEVEYEITQEKFVDWSKKPVRIPALLPLPGLPEAPKKLAAGAKIELGPPLEVQLSGTLKLPAGTTAQVPAGTSVKRDYASFVSQYSATQNVLHFSRHLNFIASELPAERSLDLNAFIHAVQNDQALLFELDKPSSVPAAAPK